MGRVSRRARHLHDLLRRHGYVAELEGSFSAPRPGIPDLPEPIAGQAIEVYRALAVGPAADPERPLPMFRPDSWDLRVEEVLVELGEERHFNRYRSKTLAVSAYEQLTTFPTVVYRALCKAHESDCLASAGYGGYWTNSSCTAMFGDAGPTGELAGKGAPRWKQRAFYDHLKDLPKFRSFHSACGKIPPSGVITLPCQHTPSRIFARQGARRAGNP
jgi:hypothetical protein